MCSTIGFSRVQVTYNLRALCYKFSLQVTYYLRALCYKLNLQVTYYLSYILFKGYMLDTSSYILFKGFMLDEREVHLCTFELCLAITFYRHYHFLPTKSYHNFSCAYTLVMLFG